MASSDSESGSKPGPTPKGGRRRRDRGEARVRVSLACEECEARNYDTTRPKRDGVTPLALKKFCTHCNKHTLHKETK